MIAAYQILLADALASIDQQIACAQSLEIEQGNADLLLSIAQVVSDLYDSRETVESYLRSSLYPTCFEWPRTCPRSNCNGMV
jgi:hypothetical protein